MSQGGEKTEKPTPKRLRDARKRGQVAKSQDLTAAALFVVAVGVLWTAGGFMGGRLLAFAQDTLARAAEEGGRLDEAAALGWLDDGIVAMATALAPLLLALVAVGALVSLGSVSLPAQITFFASIAPVCAALGVPIAPLGLLIAVETIPDIFRTLGNVSMNLAATATVSARTPQEDAHEIPLARP